MRVRRSLVLALAVATTSAGCVKPALAPLGVNVSSEQSDYSPTARLAVALAPLRLTADSIDIVIDSGRITLPGQPVGDTAPAMRDFYLTAMLVVPHAPTGDEPGLPHPWLAVAESDSVPVADAMRFGERRPLGRIHLRMPRPPGLDPGNSWLVFRMTGFAVPVMARVPGDVMGRRAPRAARFRVYACADWNLGGRVDRARARRQQVSYLAVC